MARNTHWTSHFAFSFSVDNEVLFTDVEVGGSIVSLNLLRL
jgi:hypothetical protein